MSRSVWKGYYVLPALFLRTKYTSKKIKKIWSRNSSIPQNFINQKIFIHNGRDFRYIFVNRDHVGFKFGQFMFTRNFNKSQKFLNK